MQNRGNALFLILIAVALFAALSYAVTRSGRGGGTTDRETRMLALSEAQQQSQLMVRALDRLMVVDGVPIEQVSVVNDVWPSWLNGPAHNENPNCTTTSCRLFHADGGGQVYTFPPAGLVNKCLTACTLGGSNTGMWFFSGNAFIPGIGTATGAEFLAVTRVDQQTCVDINRSLGIANPAGAPPQLPGSFAVFNSGYKGTFAATPALQNTFPAELNNQLTGCVNQQHPFYSSDFAWFYVVLLPR